ncbi:conserved hypothetical protein [Ricinus communis]|uniref:Retrotransposon gag domain-containing protein n=1 Tax=Ricinus communis TaxID=3988 RepID=B9SRV2_RICCO|nr:conserved hypothetical protein [Ricinus communis]
MRSVNDYTTKFYQLIARNEIQETEDQLDTVNLFDPVSVSAAHQRALVVERQSRRVANLNSWGGGNSAIVNNSSVNKTASSNSGSGVSATVKA